MALNTLKCNHLMPLPFKGLNSSSVLDQLRQTNYLITEWCDAHSVDGSTGAHGGGAVRYIRFHQLLCESIHLCVTLRSLQTLSEANVQQKFYCSCQRPWYQQRCANSGCSPLNITHFEIPVGHSAPAGERDIAINLSVCLSLREHISRTAGPIITKFLCRSPMAVAWSSSGGIAILYVLPVYG